MRVAVLSDIHGNAPALRAVLDELERRPPDLVVCCGDIAAGPMPRRTIDELRGLGHQLIAVRGNADREVIDVFDGHAGDGLPPDSLWGGQQITRDQRDWLAQLPATVTLQFDRLGTVLFCHATPRDDSEVVVETTAEEDLLEMLQDADADVIVCGNTHMQFDRRVGRYRVVNVGSVGMPYGRTGAFWVLLDRDVEFRRTKYNLATAAQTIRSRTLSIGRSTIATSIACGQHAIARTPLRQGCWRGCRSTSRALCDVGRSIRISGRNRGTRSATAE